MSTLFKNTITPGLGTSEVTVIDMPITARATVIGLSLANTTKDAVTVSVKLTDSSVVPSVTGYFMKDIIIPANQTLRAVNGGEKLLVAPENQLKVYADVDNSIDVIVSFVEIS